MVDSPTPHEDESPRVEMQPTEISLSLYREIHRMRLQNGLRHNDYHRYRGYCTRRLKRIRNSLKFKNGRNKYVQRPLPTGEAFNDARYLLIPLICAERGWAFGIQIKADNANSTKPTRSAHHHSLRRLQKAAGHAHTLTSLTSTYCDKKTALQAKAYSLSLTSLCDLEKGMYADAQSGFTQHIDALNQLILVSGTDAEEQVVFKQHIQSAQAQLRVCEYQLKLKGISAAAKPKDASKNESHQDSGQADVHIEWQGQQVGVPQSVQLPVCECHEMVRSLIEPHSLTISSSTAALLDKYEEISSKFNDTLKQIHKALIENDSSHVWRSVEAHSRLTSHLISAERHFLILLNCLNDHQNAFDVIEGVCHPEDGIRLADMANQAFKTLEAEVTELVDNTVWIQLCQTAVKVSVNARALFMALALSSHHKCAEAFALAKLVSTRQPTLPPISTSKVPPSPTIPSLETYLARISPLINLIQSHVTNTSLAFLPVVGAEVIEASLTESHDTGILSKATQDRGAFRFPPKLKPLPCNPVVFDLAEMEAGVPDLSHRVEKAGLMSKITGWWRK
eukprot:GHVN01011780.1.p1 GENE.GHVN01011780.1~~GHVN01011780.1.p1  ORF type:complete len:564 (-),score=101.00 GHVN01011780.1:523-2214(-)